MKTYSSVSIEGYQVNLWNEFVEMALSECQHEYAIDEKHPQIILENQLGTKRVNFCIKCGARK